MIKVAMKSKLLAHRPKDANGSHIRTTGEVCAYLDEYVIGQAEAKRAVALAHRSRGLKTAVTDNSWADVRPSNILMTGPSGVGKTELARRLAVMADAPFVKTEITEYTQVGYYGKDVESILCDLVAEAIRIAPEIYKREKAITNADDEVALLQRIFYEDKVGLVKDIPDIESMDWNTFLATYREGKFKSVYVASKFYVEARTAAVTKGGMARRDAHSDIIVEALQVSLKRGNEKDQEKIKTHFPAPLVKKLTPLLKTNVPFNRLMRLLDLRSLSVAEIRTYIDGFVASFRWGLNAIMGYIKKETKDIQVPDEFIIKLVEERGIVFIDEIDKIFLDTKGGNPGTSGVIRDLLPYLDGIVTEVDAGGSEKKRRMDHSFGGSGGKYRINTANILWIASGAFMMVPVTAIPAEILGRLPVHVRLNAFTVDDLEKIIMKPHGSELSKIQLFMQAEGVKFTIQPDAIRLIAQLAYDCNASGEDIGARRLPGVFHRLFHDLMYGASNMDIGVEIVIDAKYVAERAIEIVNSVIPHKV
jgi:ATP-dependent HslUV protease ATP-binding subunit HslU